MEYPDWHMKLQGLEIKNVYLDRGSPLKGGKKFKG